MQTITTTKLIYFCELRLFLRREGVKYQYRMGAQKEGHYLYEVRIAPDADEEKVKSAMKKYQAWITEYEHREGPNGWIDG